MKRHPTLLLLCAPLLSALLFLFLIIALDRPAGTGTICVRALDGRTDKPVTGARVVIPEAALERHTDETGRTERLVLRVERDARMRLIPDKDWGEVTVLVYADGYYPAAMFFVQVQNKRDRIGPTVYLFPNDGSLHTPYSLVEAPPSAWTERLIESYMLK